MSARRKTKARNRGVTLLVLLCVMTVTSFVLLGMFEAQTVQMSAIRNTLDYERALYLAGAGAHQALAEIEANSNWNAGIASTEFPAGSGNTFSATVTAGAGGTVVVTGLGVAGGVTRRVQVTIDPNG